MTGKSTASTTTHRALAIALLAMAAMPAFAQLNETCTVSVLNRTTRVRPDGSWLIDNVPATFGGVRARATCVQNGITQSGQSSFVNVVPNIANAFDADIVLGVTDPVPDSLTIASPSTTLTAIGQTAQLTVTANFSQEAGGGTADVTAAITGTNYTVSNQSIATVSVDGLVTAVSSGTVLVSTMNDGALGVIQLQVTLIGADSDGDGIPDDVEISFGLNPNDPADAALDLDSDGLSNLAEFNLGTIINDPDSDADGIQDGEETIAGTDGFITNPLLADSDGDGIRDGLEIQTSTDPTDPASFDLAAALQSIEVVPATFVLIINFVSPLSSRQLSVVGTMLDGATIDLTAASKGTNYTSSNLTICNFGTTDGEIFSGSVTGNCTISVANNGFAAEASGAVAAFSPEALSSIAIPGFANSVDIAGDFAYVAAGEAGLQVVDVSDRRDPQLAGLVDTPGNANDVKVVGTTAYVADGSEGLRIIDVSNPLSPAILGAADTARCSLSSGSPLPLSRML